MIVFTIKNWDINVFDMIVKTIASVIDGKASLHPLYPHCMALGFA